MAKQLTFVGNSLTTVRQDGDKVCRMIGLTEESNMWQEAMVSQLSVGDKICFGPKPDKTSILLIDTITTV